MKKIAIALAVATALSLAAPAMATEVVLEEGKLSGGYLFKNGEFTAKGLATEVKLAAPADATAGWSAEAEVDNMIVGTTELDDYKVEIYDPLLKVTAWGKGYELEDKADPFEFVESAGLSDEDEILRLRAEYGPMMLDLDGSEVRLYGEQAMGGHTLGIAAHRDVNDEDSGTTLVGYGKTNFAGVDLTGSVGVTMRQEESEDNVGYGIKGEVPVAAIAGTKVGVSYKHEPISFINEKNENTLTFEATHEQALTKGAASYSIVNNAADGQRDRNVLEIEGYWRGSAQNKDWDDQFEADKYHENVAPAVYASLTQTKDETEPTNELILKGTMPVMPGRFWVNGSIANLADKDGVGDVIDLIGFQEGRRLTEIKADGYFKATEKITVEPGFAFLTSDVEDETYTRLGAKVGYQVASNAELTAEYVREYLRAEETGDQLGLGFELEF